MSRKINVNKYDVFKKLVPKHFYEKLPSDKEKSYRKASEIFVEDEYWSKMLIANIEFDPVSYFFHCSFTNMIFLNSGGRHSGFDHSKFKNCIFINCRFYKASPPDKFENCLFFNCPLFSRWQPEPKNMKSLLFVECKGNWTMYEKHSIENIELYKSDIIYNERTDTPYKIFKNEAELKASKLYQHFASSLEKALGLDFDPEILVVEDLDDSWDFIKAYEVQ